MEFQKWLWDQEGLIVSFDFDGCLHSSIWEGTTHPCNMHAWDLWEPYIPMHEQVVKESKHSKIIIVSKRDKSSENYIRHFLSRFPALSVIKEIHCTDNQAKLPILKKLKVFKHYDDDKNMVHEMKDSGIQFVLVNVESTGCDSIYGQ